MSDNSAQYASPIPAAVRRQSVRANQIAREAGITGVESDPDAPPSDPPMQDPPVQDPPVQDPPVDPAGDTWEHRYRTLQGKYEAEIAATQHELAQLRQLIANMSAQPPAPAPVQPAAPPARATTVVPPEDVETYGEDLVVAARRWARAEMADEIADLKQQLDDVRGNTRRLDANSTWARIEAGFNADPELGSRWRALNNDSGFIAWLALPDPYAGVPRQQLLGQATASGDVGRCMLFFRTYLNEQTAVRPGPAPVIDQTLPNGGAAGNPTLEDLAAPGRSAAGSQGGAGGASQGRIWTRASITTFYDDVRRGKYRNRDAEMRQLEADIFAASNEGRIR